MRICGEWYIKTAAGDGEYIEETRGSQYVVGITAGGGHKPAAAGPNNRKRAKA